MKKNILITGSGGFLGWNLCRTASENFNVTGIIRNNKINLDNVSTVYCDLTDQHSLLNIFNTAKPDIVIHAAAASDPNFCQQHQIESEVINVDTSVFLADLCGKKRIKLIFISTDLVFDGTRGNYRESSDANPLNIYGQQKLRAENEILLKNPDATICRMPLMFGDTPEGSKRFLQLWIEQLRDKKMLNLFNDEFRTPVSATDASEGILHCSDNNSGIIHLGGKERISRYEMGCIIAELTGVSKNLITSCSQDDIKMAAPRPKDVSLDSTKAFGMGYNPGKIYDELRKLECLKIR